MRDQKKDIRRNAGNIGPDKARPSCSSLLHSTSCLVMSCLVLPYFVSLARRTSGAWNCVCRGDLVGGDGYVCFFSLQPTDRVLFVCLWTDLQSPPHSFALSPSQREKKCYALHVMKCGVAYPPLTMLCSACISGVCCLSQRMLCPNIPCFFVFFLPETQLE